MPLPATASSTDGSLTGPWQMPSAPTSSTWLGEAALLQIALRTTDHERLAASDGLIDALAGRHLWLDQSQLRHGNALVDIVAVTENFTSARLLELRPNLTDRQVFTWERRRQAWQDHGPVDLTSVSANWLALMGFVEVRNALQHGLGHLTATQLSRNRRSETLERIKAARVSLSGDLVHVDADAVRHCREICEGYVISLDSAAPIS